jgi:hypothetical protein
MKIGEKNVGMIDRVVRIVVGFLVLGYGAKFISFPLNMVVALIGFAIVATGAIGTCALYSLIGINTSGSEKSEEKPASPAPKARKKSK